MERGRIGLVTDILRILLMRNLWRLYNQFLVIKLERERKGKDRIKSREI